MPSVAILCGTQGHRHMHAGRGSTCQCMRHTSDTGGPEQSIPGAAASVPFHSMFRCRCRCRCRRPQVLAAIGEQFSEGEEICGVAVNVRGRGDRVDLWTRTASNEAAQVRPGHVPGGPLCGSMQPSPRAWGGTRVAVSHAGIQAPGVHSFKERERMVWRKTLPLMMLTRCLQTVLHARQHHAR